GLPGADNPFASPPNQPPNAGRPALDLTVIHTPAGRRIATADGTVYAVAADGSATRTTAFSTTLLPTRITAADLTGDALDDIILADSLDNSIQVAFQQPDGTFSAPITLRTGETPSDIAVADVNGDRLPDIVVSNQASGDVSVFLNDASHSFATRYRFRAG